MRPVINLDEVEMRARHARHNAPGAAAERFGGSTGEVSARIGARKLGYNITAVPPGKRAFPFHNHRVNEELFFILEGRGEVRFGNERHAVRKGDFIACPPGGPEVAHQIINTGADELKYLAVSTLLHPEICDYPDSKKFLVAELPRDAAGNVQGFRHIGSHESALDYWDGE
jgi:uncharacterized cupin superfamily protein